MKKLTLLSILLSFVILLAWCGTNNNFMDVDNPNAKDDLKTIVWNKNIPDINTKDLVPDSLSWTLQDVKWYANQYYEDTLQWYVNTAKEWLSWAKENLKWRYNEWVDELNSMITDKVNWAISWELNKFKIN